MHIVDAYWTPTVNMLVIWCPCARRIFHPANRWTVRCQCGNQDNLEKVRNRFVERMRARNH